MTQRIALAEHSVTIRHAVRVSLSSLDFELVEVSTATELLDLLCSGTISLCILSSRLPGLETVSLSDSIDESTPPILCLTEGAQPSSVVNIGSQQLLLPFESQVLVEAVCSMLDVDVPDQDLYAPYRIEVPLAHKMSDGGRAEDGQTVELNPISDEDEAIAANADFDESVHTDTMSDRGESKSNSGMADKTLAVGDESQSHEISRSETYEVSPEQVLDALPDLADFDESDSVTNPVDAISPEEAGLSLPQDPQNQPPEIEIDQEQVELPIDAPAPSSNQEHDLELVSNLEKGPIEDEVSMDSQSEFLLDNLPENLADLETLRALNVSKEVVERVAWAVVPVLAEAIIKEEVRKLLDSRVQNDPSA